MRIGALVLVVGVILAIGMFGYAAFYDSSSDSQPLPSENEEGRSPSESVPESTAPTNLQPINASPTPTTPRNRGGGGGGGGGGGSPPGPTSPGDTTPPVNNTNSTNTNSTTTNSTNTTQTNTELLNAIYALANATRSYSFITTQVAFQNIHGDQTMIDQLTHAWLSRETEESTEDLEIRTWIDGVFSSLLNLSVQAGNGTVTTSSPSWNENYTRNLTSEVFLMMDPLARLIPLLTTGNITFLPNETADNQTYYVFEVNTTQESILFYIDALEIPAPMRSPPFTDYPMTYQTRFWVNASSYAITKSYIYTSSSVENASLMVQSVTTFEYLS